MGNTSKTDIRNQYISIFICWLAYVSVNFVRYSYNANIGIIESDYGVSHASAGLVVTFFAVTYGTGQILHGIFCRHYPRRLIVSLALAVAATMNLLIFIGVPFEVIKYLWLVSAIFQSLLWPMTMQVISENVDAARLRKGILAMSTTSAVGILIIYGISAAFSAYNYRLTFLTGSIIVYAVAALWFVLYKPGNYGRINIKEENEESGRKRKGLPLVLFLPIALLVIFSMITNFVKDGFQTWVPVILKNIKPDLGDGFSILLTLVLPVFGIFGATFAVLLHKKLNKVIVLSLFFLSFTALFDFIVMMFRDNLIVTVISFGILELLMHGCANAIVSIFPLTMREKMSSGALTGILNGAAYVGSAASSFLLGKIADVSGWTAVFGTILGAVGAAIVLGVIYLIFSVKKPEINV